MMTNQSTRYCRRSLVRRAIASSTLTALLTMCLITPAFASAYQGYVTNVFALRGKVQITLNGGNFDGPAAVCGGNAASIGYVADPATPYGRTLVALALSAKLTGRLVWVGGDGNCTTGVENLNNLDLKG